MKTPVIFIQIFYCGALLLNGAFAFSNSTDAYMVLNPDAGRTVLYEVQVRTANACDPTIGSTEQRAQCAAKAAPAVKYRAEGMSCDRGTYDGLSRIKLGTLDDMLLHTTDFRSGITIDYIRDRIGANMVWLMPLFPNNDTWNLPDGCDNLGSPYAVRDYMHASGMISRTCISKGADEHNDAAPCWGNDTLDKFIQESHAKGLKVMLDVAFNHFGHNYQMYDYAEYTPIRDRLASGKDINDLWNFAGDTYEENLLHPRILDTPEALQDLAEHSDYHKNQLAQLQGKCPALNGQPLVRSYHMWLNALDWERASFKCDGGALEFENPGFYLGRNSFDPSHEVGDNFTNNWSDVKFLYHHEENVAHRDEFVRNREYLFRVVNYWVSRGVDGFRFDHTTDPSGGMGPNEWKYILSKVDYYAARRGQARPIYLAEEFGDQMGMNHVVDVMTDGYIGNMSGRGVIKDTAHVERVINNNARFQGHTFVMSALETHDEARLLNSGAGFGLVTGAGFWAIGATTWSTPMILMGQEFGETYGLGFRRSDFLRARFVGTSNYQDGQNEHVTGDTLANLYGKFIHGRLDYANRALVDKNTSFMRPKDNTSAPDPRIFAIAKWSDDGNVVFAFHNLWQQNVSQNYAVPGEVASTMNHSLQYQLVDILSGQRQGSCIWANDLLNRGLYVAMDSLTIAQWLRLEICH